MLHVVARALLAGIRLVPRGTPNQRVEQPPHAEGDERHEHEKARRRRHGEAQVELEVAVARAGWDKLAVDARRRFNSLHMIPERLGVLEGCYTSVFGTLVALA